MTELESTDGKTSAGKSTRDVASGCVLFVVAALYFVATWDLPAGRGEPGPAFFPFLLSCALMLLSLAILGRGLGLGSAPFSSVEETSVGSSVNPWLAVAVTCVYIALFQVLGFTLTTLLYTLSIAMVFRRDRIVVLVIVPVVSTVLIYLLFRVGLGVRLPEGILRSP